MNISFSTIPYMRMQASLGRLDKNNYARYLHCVFDNLLLPERTDNLLHMYCMGTCAGGRSIFWRLDAQRRVRTGRVLLFDVATGLPISNPQWMHERPPFANSGFRAEPVLFGAHLAGRYPQSTIWMFETEADALIAALYLHWLGSFPQSFVAIADADCTADLSVLKNRSLVIFPSRNTYAQWQEKRQLLASHAHRVNISDIMERGLADADTPGQLLAQFISCGRANRIIHLPLYSSASSAGGGAMR